MEEKHLKINYITAVSTFILAFVAIIGLMFALTEFIETKILGPKISLLIFISIFLGLIASVLIIKRWIKNESS